MQIMAIEECVSRSTMAWRDTALAEYYGKPKLTGAKLQMQKLVWSAAAANSMFIEVVAIVRPRGRSP